MLIDVSPGGGCGVWLPRLGKSEPPVGHPEGLQGWPACHPPGMGVLCRALRCAMHWRRKECRRPETDVPLPLPAYPPLPQALTPGGRH